MNRWTGKQEESTELAALFESLLVRSNCPDCTNASTEVILVSPLGRKKGGYGQALSADER